MNSGRIYHSATSSEDWTPMTEAPYEAEEVLQRLLAEHPDLLAGDQILPSDPRRWLLITREAGVPDVEGGANRWSLDHLFVDQDAVPTLVEVKRRSDTRVRREVVAQMLDYAANIVAHWPPGHLRDLFAERVRAEGNDPDETLLAFLGEQASDARDEDPAAAFWARAADNLTLRQMRLVFVADVIPRELQRIVEFLNESMARTEVLALEVHQYLGEGHRILVPRVIGNTSAAEEAKQTSTGARAMRRDWTVEELLAMAAPELEPIVRGLHDFLVGDVEGRLSPRYNSTSISYDARIDGTTHLVLQLFPKARAGRRGELLAYVRVDPPGMAALGTTVERVQAAAAGQGIECRDQGLLLRAADATRLEVFERILDAEVLSRIDT